MNPKRVYVSQLPPCYSGVSGDCFPELIAGAKQSPALGALRNLLHLAQLDPERFGTAQWNPLESWLGAGQRFVIKPNWVHHLNASGQGLDCLVTHSSVIEAVVEYVALTHPSGIIVGDAPIQSCDFVRLLDQSGWNESSARLSARGIPVEVRDFRLTTRTDGAWAGDQNTVRSEDDYVRFNLGKESLLEPVSGGNSRFRITMYDPKALAETHGPANHQYLVAREILDANVVINLPKLKTHKKAGITGALKNLVGANGHKSYLPHHRKGSTAAGGDCYAHPRTWSSLGEDLLDRANGAEPGIQKKLYGRAAGAAIRAGRLFDGDFDLEGSWFGNDTVWRMVIDLQRILHYGKSAGNLSTRQQRTILNLTDAIVGGQGEGPLAPEPAALGFLSMGASAAACDWVHAALMGLDPERIPLTREALAALSGGPSGFQSGDIRVCTQGGDWAVAEAARRMGSQLRLPAGWRGHCEASVAGELTVC